MPVKINQSMQFGPWIADKRQTRRLGLVDIAEIASVDASTVSRIENQRTQATLPTAIRLIEALTVPVEEVAKLLQIQTESARLMMETPSEPDPDVISAQELFSLTRMYAGQPSFVKPWIANLLNAAAEYQAQRPDIMAKRQFSGFPAFVPDDVDKLLANPPIARLEVRYPDLATNRLLDWYRKGGALTLADAGAVIRGARSEQKVRQSELRESGVLSPGIISRLETGSVDLVKFEDIWRLDQSLKRGGDVIGMYWQAVKFQMRIQNAPYLAVIDTHVEMGGDWAINAYDFATLFMITWRWIELRSDTADWRANTKAWIERYSPWEG